VTDNWRRPWPTVDPTWVLSAQGRAKNYHFFPTNGKPLQRHLIELSRVIKIRHSLIVAQTCAGSLSALRFPNIAFPAYVTLSVGVATPPSRNVTTVGKNAVVSALSPCQLISSSYRTRLLFLLSHCASCVEDAWLESPLPLVADHALISRPALPRRHLGRVHAAQTMRFCLQSTG
jgi:hypothetical protein